MSIRNSLVLGALTFLYLVSTDVNSMRKTICLLLAFCLSTLINAQDSAESRVDLSTLNFEELLNLKVKTAHNFDQSIQDIPYSVSIISKEDIEIYGYRSLSEALENIPGFYMMDDHTALKENFGVRGSITDSWNNNLIILINGVNQRFIYDFTTVMPSINIAIQSIERIEVIRGPASVTYGTGAFLGVVNIITKTDKDKIDVWAGAGTQGTFNAGDNVFRKINDTRLTLNSSFSQSDGIEQNYNDISGDTNLSSQDFMHESTRHISLLTDGPLVSTNISFDHHTNNRPTGAAPYASSIYEGETEFIAVRTGIEVHKSFKDKIHLNASYQYQHQIQQFDFDFLGLNYDQETQRMSFDSYELKLNAQFDITKNLKLYYGSHITHLFTIDDRIDVPLISSLDNLEKSLTKPMTLVGNILRLNWKINTKLHFQTGLRIDNTGSHEVLYTSGKGNQFTTDSTSSPFAITKYTYKRPKTALLPEASLTYELAHNQYLKLFYAKAINRPSAFETNSVDLLNLTPEFIQNGELNYFAIINNKIRLNSSILYIYGSDLIEIDFSIKDGVQTQNRTNSGKMSTLGFESEFEYKPNSHFTFNTSLNYYNTTDHHYPGTTPAYSPKFLGYLKTSYRNNNWSLAITANYVSKTESDFNHQLIVPQDVSSPEKGRIGRAAPSYLNMGINGRWNPNFIKGAYVNLRVSNLLNQKMYYPVNDFNSWTKLGTLGISRTALLTMGYSF